MALSATSTLGVIGLCISCPSPISFTEPPTLSPKSALSNMSRRIVEVESESDGEVFDDDTDLPLPGTTSKNKQSLPNTGSRGALLEEITIEQEPTAGPEVPSRVRPSKPPQRAPPGGSSTAPGAGLMDSSDPMYQAFLRANAEAGGGRRPETVLEGTPEMEKYKKYVSIWATVADSGGLVVC